jgi:hypothetical protein
MDALMLYLGIGLIFLFWYWYIDNPSRRRGLLWEEEQAAAITRLVGAVLLEQDEHWQLEGRRMFSLDSMAAIPAAADELPSGAPATSGTA